MTHVSTRTRPYLSASAPHTTPPNADATMLAAVTQPACVVEIPSTGSTTVSANEYIVHVTPSSPHPMPAAISARRPSLRVEDDAERVPAVSAGADSSMRTLT